MSNPYLGGGNPMDAGYRKWYDGMSAALAAAGNGQSNGLGRAMDDSEIKKFVSDYAYTGGGRGHVASAAEYAAALKGYGSKLSAIDSLGVQGLSAADKLKLVDNFKPGELDDISAIAKSALGKGLQGSDILNALRQVNFRPNTDALQNIFGRLQQRNQGIAALETMTGSPLDQETRDMLKNADDATFNQQIDKIGRTFTPGQNYQDQVGNAFQSILGRSATSDEIQHFGQELARGTYDPQQFGEYLKQTSEYQNVATGKARDQLSAQAQGIDNNFLQQLLPQITGSFADQGRGIGGTSAIGAQFAQAAQGLAQNRQNFLLGLGAQDLGQNRAADYAQFQQNQQRALGGFDQRAQYQSYLNQQSNAQRTNVIPQGFGNLQQQQLIQQQRGFQLQDFQNQQNAYSSFLNANKSQSLTNGLFGLAGAGIGAAGNIYGGYLAGLGRNRNPYG